MTTTRARVVVSTEAAVMRFCGRTLVERHVEQLRRAGVTDVEIVEAGDGAIRGPGPFGPGGTCRTLLVAAERVFDPRLYEAALRETIPVILTDGGTPIGLEMAAPVARPATGLDIAALDPYSRELRRALRPYWIAVRGPEDRRRVRDCLIAASYKGHQDLPAELFNRPLETAILRWTADTPTTPDAITIACNVLAYLVAALFATGHAGWAIAGALFVGVLDGVDGRQARVQLRTTAFGALEHVLDKGYEIAWMVALAFHLSGGFTGGRAIVAALAVWTAAYLLDTAAYDVFRWRRGVRLDEASAVDAALRRVAGRRNVYVWILAAGVATGLLRPAFYGVCGWAAATAVVHWARVAWLLRSGPERPALIYSDR